MASSLSATATETLWRTPALLESEPGFADALAALKSNGEASFDGVWGSASALLAAELARHCPGPLLVVAARESALDAFCDDWAVFSPLPVLELPAYEPAPLDRLLRDEDFGARLSALKRLAGPDPPRMVAATIASLLQPFPAPELLQRNTLRIQVGQRLDPVSLVEWLARRGFHSTSAVELPGEYAFRGGLCDLFTPDWQQPVRVEFFDDQVESIRRFDIVTQRSLEGLQSLEIAVPIAAGSLSERTPGAGQDAEGKAAVLLDHHEHLAAWLPPTSWLLLLEPDQAAIEAEEHLARLSEGERQHSFQAVMASLSRFSRATASALAMGGLGANCRLAIDSVERMRGELAQVRQSLNLVARDCRTHVVLPTEADVERMRELLADTDVAARGELHFHRGALHQGFRLRRQRVLLLAANDLLDRGELRRTARRRLGKAIDSFLDLKEGDLVVHLGHGIGRYRGLKLIRRAEHEEEHLEIEFRGGTRVFVPAAKIDLVQKYIGGTKGRPSLAQIGGKSWSKQKRAAERAVTDMAAEMLALQAARRARPGIAFQPDTIWQREFDAQFPYEETPDQLAAIREIKADMESPRPMDRLLCGDVGFGKTEVAMRAVFKAVENGYQVAVLTPTTVLAEQHFRTFHERMAAFPLEIGKLSRFCSAAEQRAVIEKLKKGRIDVVIGTHRLASADVAFHNLGLVIIDEEQRFGVEVKERLKSLRTTVDVLTMTATPIPRTLHMSLVGVRDISNLETPPAERMAVETRVSRFDRDLIRGAILRELDRGGQIYVVHNRIQDIEIVASILRQIAPEARLRIGHGQMDEGELEQVMVDFVDHRFDLLLATTIIESGLDIPNANTIFINEADRYGLADLHQLRGRVGRYKHRAYAYLLIDPRKHVTPNAARRLRAIEEFSQIGAGFGIAMRDLEIRGAGNLLGVQQSGHIAAVGYELYCQLLENAVRQAQSLPPKLSIDVDIDLPGAAHLPADYVPDMRLKIDLYRRLARTASYQDIAELRAEMNDRFGDLPPPAARMLAMAELRLDAAAWQIAAIRREDRFLVFRYVDRKRIELLSRLSKGKLRVVDDKSAYLTVSTSPGGAMSADPDVLFTAAKSVLQSK